MRIMAYSFLWVMQDLYHQPCVCQVLQPLKMFQQGLGVVGVWVLVSNDLELEG